MHNRAVFCRVFWSVLFENQSVKRITFYTIMGKSITFFSTVLRQGLGRNYFGIFMVGLIGESFLLPSFVLR